jgi:hypothetical protein
MKPRESLWAGYVTKGMYFESAKNSVEKFPETLLFGRLRWKWKKS